MSVITGRVKKYDGTAIDYVSIFNWTDGKCIAQLPVNAAGNWQYEYFKNINVGITYVANGCEPITHGAYDFLGYYNPRKALLGKQGIWFQPSDLSTLFQDDAGTTPVTTDGQKVGLMRDKSDNGYHAMQSVSAKRPTYRTDGTKHWLQFSGAQSMATPSFVLTTKDGHTHVIDVSYAAIASITSSSADVGGSDNTRRIGYFGNMDAAGKHRTFIFIRKPGIEIPNSATLLVSSIVPAVENQRYLVSSLGAANLATLKLRIDGSEVASASNNTVVDYDRSGKLTIGSSEANETQYFYGNFYGAVHIASALSSGDLLDLETFMQADNH